MVSLYNLAFFTAWETLEGTGGLGWVERILILALLAGLVFVINRLVAWVIRRVNQAPSTPVPYPTAPSTALEILQERYASGEITSEQYQQMLEDLSK
jgi:uncharacterized membrane protein